MNHRKMMALLLALLVGVMPVSAQETLSGWLGVSVGESAAHGTVTVIGFVPLISPAQDAGIRIGDEILAVDGETITTVDQFVNLIRTYSPDDEVTLLAWWLGEEREITVRLGQRPPDEELEVMELPPEALRSFQLILRVVGLSLINTADGVVVDAVNEESLLGAYDFMAGDVITAIGGVAVADFSGEAFSDLMLADTPLTISLARAGEPVELTLDESALDIAQTADQIYAEHAPYPDEAPDDNQTPQPSA